MPPKDEIITCCYFFVVSNLRTVFRKFCIVVGNDWGGK